MTAIMRAGKGKPTSQGLSGVTPPGRVRTWPGKRSATMGSPQGPGRDYLSGGRCFLQESEWGSKNPKNDLFLTPLAKGKLKKTTVFEQNKQRGVSN